MNNIPRIPLGEWVDSFVASLYEHFEGLFRGFSYIIGGFVDLLTNFLAIIPGTTPTPKNVIAGIRYTKAGIVCIKSNVGFKNFENRSFCEAKIPIGIPTMIEIITDVSTRANVCIVCAQ